MLKGGQVGGEAIFCHMHKDLRGDIYPGGPEGQIYHI